MRARLPAASIMLLTGLAMAIAAADRPDILIADFEGPDYGDWKAEGEAFGTGPARGTLPNQMAVSGFLGKGLVNSFHKGDGATGTLTSPPFKIERDHINFLVGGGKYAGETCINLRVDDKIVRTATGPNDRPGGSEALDWHAWDVRDLAGKNATLQIIDQRTGGWGHINIDHIVQTDRPKRSEPASRELLVERRFLHLPVKTGAPKRRLELQLDGRAVRAFDIELAPSDPDFWVFCDLGGFAGKKLLLHADRLPNGASDLAAIRLADTLPDGDKLYQEPRRPQYHFTSRRGWLNDPNGLLYYKGEYHLFYQHNPYGWSWGNMHWGHAVSKDLVRWREQPIALYPQRHGDWCFSGSGVVDGRNTSGFKEGNEDVLVVAYTSTGRGECIAYSNDRGQTWKEYAGNPVLRHQGRDPKLLWHEPSRQWVMAVYDEFQGARCIAFHTSPDLKRWTFQSRIPDFYECPDLFELAVDGKAGATKWVLHAADGKYLLGQFDGKQFVTESGKHQLWYGRFYAAQTFSNVPDGRCIQIGWGNGITFPGMPFNQQMTVPVELSLRTTGEGVRLFAEPVKELASLQQLPVLRDPQKTVSLTESNPLQISTPQTQLRVKAEVDVGTAALVSVTVHGIPIEYDVKKQELHCQKVVAPLKPVAGRLRLDILQDRGSIEVFANDGQVAISSAALPQEGQMGQVRLTVRGGAASLHSLNLWPMKSAWTE